MRQVIKECMTENNMEFDDNQIDGLAKALYEDAAGIKDSDGNTPEHPGITIDQLKAELGKHPGLLENLSIK